MKAKQFLFKLLTFILLPIVIGELLLRIFTRPWADPTLDLIKRQKIDFIFVGSSRVAAAISDTTFSRIVGDSLMKNITSINVGRGYSTFQEHYLRLREAISTNPENFKGCTVFIETWKGLPFSKKDWKSEWILLQLMNGSFIVPFLHLPDIESLWLSKSPISHKSYLTFSYSSAFVLKSPQASIKLMSMGEWYIKKIINADKNTDANLTSAGGIRTDKRGIKAAQEMAEMEKNKKPEEIFASAWEKSILKDIVHLVQSNGGKVIFYETPLPSFHKYYAATEPYLKSKTTFMTYAQKWNTPLIEPEIVFPDSDFPDAVHLGKSKSVEFTTSLADAYLKKISEK